MSAFRFRAVALLMLVLHLGACMTWQPSPISPRQWIEEEQPKLVRVTTTDGSQVVLSDPRIDDDSLGLSVSGQLRPCHDSANLACPRSVPLDSISTVEGPYQHVAGSLAAIAVVVLVALVITAISSFEGPGFRQR